MTTESSVFIIAEAGVNHNGDLDLARRLIDVGADAGVDAVKFQTFKSDELVSSRAPKADYQKAATDPSQTQLEMLRGLELTESDHEVLIDHTRSRGVTFLSTPFDLASLHLLTGRFGLKTIKISSGDLTNAPFLLAVARNAQRVILSTGMSTLDEVEAALGVLAYGFTVPEGTPTRDEFNRSLQSESGRQALGERVTLLHCTSEYPAPYDGVNLGAMTTMSSAFNLPVGYSDHTLGIHVALAAVALGATVIEKHFTVDRALPGPDHKASSEPDELKELVRRIREVELSLGTGVKEPAVSEIRNREVVRKSLVASRPIEAGETFTEDNVACKRPGSGVSPFRYWQTLGQTASHPYAVDQELDELSDA